MTADSDPIRSMEEKDMKQKNSKVNYYGVMSQVSPPATAVEMTTLIMISLQMFVMLARRSELLLCVALYSPFSTSVG